MVSFNADTFIIDWGLWEMCVGKVLGLWAQPFGRYSLIFTEITIIHLRTSFDPILMKFGEMMTISI